MRWRTFERLEAQYSDLQRRAMHAMMVKLERLCRTARGALFK